MGSKARSMYGRFCLRGGCALFFFQLESLYPSSMESKLSRSAALDGSLIVLPKLSCLKRGGFSTDTIHLQQAKEAGGHEPKPARQAEEKKPPEGGEKKNANGQKMTEHA